MGISYIIPCIAALLSLNKEKINPLHRWLNKDFSYDNYYISSFEFTIYLIRGFFGLVSSIFIIRTTKKLSLEYKTLKKYYRDRNFSFFKYAITALGYPLVNLLSYITAAVASGLECFCREKCSSKLETLSYFAVFSGSIQGILFAICFCINTNTHIIIIKNLPCNCCCKKIGLSDVNVKPLSENNSDDEEEERSEEQLSESSLKNSMYS